MKYDTFKGCMYVSNEFRDAIFMRMNACHNNRIACKNCKSFTHIQVGFSYVQLLVDCVDSPLAWLHLVQL